jgi:nitric oxide synthase-interacting protein
VLFATPEFLGQIQSSILPKSASKKRKLDFSPTHVERLAQEAEEEALRLIKQEQAEALRHKLPDFWLPSLTPTYASSGPPKDLKDIKVRTVCRSGADTHEIS